MFSLSVSILILKKRFSRLFVRHILLLVANIVWFKSTIFVYSLVSYAVHYNFRYYSDAVCQMIQTIATLFRFVLVIFDYFPSFPAYLCISVANICSNARFCFLRSIATYKRLLSNIRLSRCFLHRLNPL